MQIDSVEIIHLGLPLRQAIKTPLGPVDTLETVLVRLQSGETCGWGESSPGNGPTLNDEWAAGAFSCLRDWLAPAVVSTSVDSGDELAEQLDKFRGNPFAKAALDAAWWDLNARRQEKPLHQVLDGKRESIEVGATFDQMDSIDDFIAAIGRAVEAGFSRAKLKFRPGWDVRMVDFVRKEFPTLEVLIDCEGGLGLQHMEMLCRLDDFALTMIEQPFGADDLVGHAMAQDTIRTPICLDESITSVARADMAMELKSCRYVNLKQGRVGGLTSAMAIDDLCRQNQVPCYLGAMPQTTIGARAGLALAARENFTAPADFFPAHEILEQDLAEPLLPQPDAEDGKMQVSLWSEPGIGVEPDEELLERFSIGRVKV